MISMYSDAALPISFSSPAEKGHARFLREVVRKHDGGTWNDAPSDPLLDRSTKVDPPSGDRLHDDSLDAVRGLVLSVVLGLGCWIIIGAVVRAIFF